MAKSTKKIMMEISDRLLLLSERVWMGEGIPALLTIVDRAALAAYGATKSEERVIAAAQRGIDECKEALAAHAAQGGGKH